MRAIGASLEFLTRGLERDVFTFSRLSCSFDVDETEGLTLMAFGEIETLLGNARFGADGAEMQAELGDMRGTKEEEIGIMQFRYGIRCFA